MGDQWNAGKIQVSSDLHKNGSSEELKFTRFPAYRQCFSQLLGLKWREHDAFDGTHRINAIMDMYKGQGAVSSFILPFNNVQLSHPILHHRSATSFDRGRAGYL